MFCEKCGRQVMQGEKFCRSCGNPVSADIIPSQQRRAAQPNVPPVFDPRVRQNPPVIPNRPPKEKKTINKKMLISAVILFVIVIAAVIAGIVFLSSSKVERDVNEALNSKSYSVLSDTLVKYMYSDDAYEAEKCVAAFIDNATKTVNDEFDSTVTDEKDWENIDTLLYEFCKNRWGDIIYFSDGQKSGLFNMESTEIQDALYELESMLVSKECYYSGLSYLNYPQHEDDYFDAVEDFAEVLPDDKNYSSALEKTGEAFSAYMSLADKYIEDGDWSAAISLLEGANEWCEEAREYLGDYNKETAEYVAKLNEVEKKYAAQYVQKAEEYFKAGDIDAAIGSIEAAISIDPDGGYDAKLSEYKMYLPFALYDENNVLKVESDDEFWGNITFDVAMESNDNKQMAHSLRWYNNNDQENPSSRLYYKLGGKYDTISGVIFLSKDYKNSNLAGYFEIFGDDKLLYTSPKVYAGVLPQEINVDVSGVQELKIAFHGNGTGGFLGEGADYGVSNLTARKNVPQ